MAVAVAINYNKKLLTQLEKEYTKQQIDDFAWYGDIEKDTFYALSFIDHEVYHRYMVYMKLTGEIHLVESIHGIG